MPRRDEELLGDPVYISPSLKLLMCYTQHSEEYCEVSKKWVYRTHSLMALVLSNHVAPMCLRRTQVCFDSVSTHNDKLICLYSSSLQAPVFRAKYPNNQRRFMPSRRRSLDRKSAATLVHAFVTGRIDYGNALLANAPRTTTDKLQRILNAAARVITATRKFHRVLTHILHDELHWLDVPQRVAFKLCTTVCKCLHGLTPQYLSELCVPVADVAGRVSSAL